MMRPLKHNNSIAQRAGFSLMEILVTVAIIGVLSAMLVPTVNKAVERGRMAQCSNTLRQLGTAFVIYAGENDGKIPAAASPAAGSDNLVGNWFQELSPYVNQGGAVLSQQMAKLYKPFSCQTFLAKYANKPDYNAGWLGYGMNLRLNLRLGAEDLQKAKEVTSKTRLRLGLIPSPSRTILIGEATGYNLDLGPNGYKFVKSENLEGWKLGGTPDRHEGLSNYLFVDGHVETLTPDQAEELLKPDSGT